MGAKPGLHGELGTALKATTVVTMLDGPGVKTAYSRPGVSDDNVYAVSLLRAAKCCSVFHAKDFADLDQARTWANGVIYWYNLDHRHSGIRDVSPAQPHAGDDHEILAEQYALYLQARELSLARWSGNTRNWTPIVAITLNPERDSILQAHLASNNIQLLAA